MQQISHTAPIKYQLILPSQGEMIIEGNERKIYAV